MRLNVIWNAAMSKDILKSLAYLLWGILIGIIIERVFSQNLINRPQEFYNARLFEILQLISTIVIAVFVTYYIKISTSHALKQKEILYELLSNFQNQLNDIVKLGYDYVNSHSLEEQRRIIIMFKNLSILLGIISEAKKPKNVLPIIDDRSFHLSFIKLKKSITDKPFSKHSTLNSENSEKMITQIQQSYSRLLSVLYKCKLNLYS